MKKILELFKMLNKSSKSNLDSANIFLMVLISVVVVGALGYFSYKYAPLIAMVEGGGVSTLILLVGFTASILIFFLGLMKLINSMYMSSDIEVLITLPFSATQIATLRVLAYFRFAFVATFFATLAPCIGFALASPVTIMEWVAAILAGILVPTFSVSVCAIIVILIMSFLKIFRNRDVLRYIGSGVLFLLLCGYMFLYSGSKIDLKALMLGSAKVMSIVRYCIPVIGFIIESIKSGNFIYLLISILCTAVSVALFILVSKVFYLNGALNMQDAGKGKVLKDADLEKLCKKKTVSKALFAKEYQMVKRNPVYLLNNFILGALWPVVVLILFKQLLPIFNDIMSDSNTMEFIQEISFSSFIIVSAVLSIILIAFVYFPLGVQTIAYSSISREGDSFPIMKQLPVSYEVQLNAKYQMARTVSQISVTGYSLLIMIIAAILLKISFLYCIIPLAIVFLFTDFVVNFDMFIGIQNASVSWDDEKEAVKKPFISSIGIIITWIVLLAAFSGVTFLAFIDAIFGLIAIVVLVAILVVASIFLQKRILVDGEKKIRRLHF